MIAIRNTQQYAVQDTHTNTNTEMQVNLTGSGHLAQAPTTGSDDHCALALTRLLLSVPRLVLDLTAVELHLVAP